MSDKTVVVFTAKSAEHILSEGGTSSWRLDRNNARACDFAVCTQNAHADGDWATGTKDHHAAFLVGKVKDVVPSPTRPERYLIQFSEYALVNIPEVWQGERNPVRYTTLKELGIDPAALDFKPMSELAAQPGPALQAIPQITGAALTMAEAKKGLALTFGVSPEAIEITIRLPA